MPKDFNRESAAGAALPESDVHYPLIAEAATDAIITIDSDSTILVSPPTEKDLRCWPLSTLLERGIGMTKV